MYEIKDVEKHMDEMYRPFTSKDDRILTDQIKEEMVSLGLDPINKHDIMKFWESKGITLING
jgi:hypothetical protein